MQIKLVFTRDVVHLASFDCLWYSEVAREAQTYFRSSLLSLRSDDRKYVCASQANSEVAYWSLVRLSRVSLKSFSSSNWSSRIQPLGPRYMYLFCVLRPVFLYPASSWYFRPEKPKTCLYHKRWLCARLI